MLQRINRDVVMIAQSVIKKFNTQFDDVRWKIENKINYQVVNYKDTNPLEYYHTQ